MPVVARWATGSFSFLLILILLPTVLTKENDKEERERFLRHPVGKPEFIGIRLDLPTSQLTVPD
jgi:hypothetical protein